MKRQNKLPADDEAEQPALSDGGKIGERQGVAGFPPRWWRREWLIWLGLIAVTFLAYQPVWHAGFIFDDDSLVTDNPAIKSANGLYRLWFTTSLLDYYPMTYSLWWLEWRAWASHPLGYHLVNVLLHALSAGLLWRVLQGLKIPGALLAAAIFAVHPVNVESAAWIAEGKNTLAMFFYAGTVLCWLKFGESGRGRWYGLALAGFALALLSKSAVAPLPIVLLGLAWWRRGRVGWKDLRQVAPFFVIAAALGLVTVWFQYHRAIGPGIVRSDNIWSRLAVAGCAVWFYVYKAVLPLNLAFVYPRWQIDARNVAPYVPLVLLALAFVLCWRGRRSWGKGLFFGLGYFVVMLLPILGFLDIGFMQYSLVADHWEYFAIIGPIALAAAHIKKPAVAMLLLLALAALTWRQCGIYADEETLWRTTLRSNPDCWMARDNLGLALLHQGRADEAISQFQKSLEIVPEDSRAHNNLGMLLGGQGKWDEAIAHLQAAVKYFPRNDQAYYNLGFIYLQQHRYDAAVAQFRSAIKINPQYDKAFANLGIALARQGHLDEAIGQYRQALAIAPNYPYAHYALGRALESRNKLEEAASHYKAAIAIKPDFAEARKSLAAVLSRPHEADHE